MTQSRLHARLYFLACLVLWLVPFFIAGWTNRTWRWLPRPFNFQHSAAGLFTHETTRWWDHGLELQRADGKWVEVEERRIFPMGAFGFRTRLDRILNESNRCRQKQGIQKHLAEHAWGRIHAERWPEAAGMKSLRLVRSIWPVGCQEMAIPEGEWGIPKLSALSAGRRETLAEYKLEKGKLVAATAPKPKALAAIRLPASPPRRILMPPMPLVPRGLPMPPDQADSETPPLDELVD